MKSKRTIARKTNAPRTVKPAYGQLLADRLAAMNAAAALDNAAQDAHNIALVLRRALSTGQDADIAFARLVDHIASLKSDIKQCAGFVSAIRDRESAK